MKTDDLKIANEIKKKIDECDEALNRLYAMEEDFSGVALHIKPTGANPRDVNAPKTVVVQLKNQTWERSVFEMAVATVRADRREWEYKAQQIGLTVASPPAMAPIG